MSNMLLLDINDRRALEGFVDGEKAITIAAKNTLNTQVALSRRNGVSNVERNFTTRGTWTKRNIAYEKTEATRIQDMEARVGAREGADYMKLQEEGGVHKPKSGSRLAIPEDPARGGSFARPVSREYYLRKMRGNRIVKGKFRGKKRHKGTAISRAVAAAFIAQKTGKLIKRDTGIYQVTRFRKKGGSISYRMTRLYNLQKRSTRVPKNPWLLPGTEKPAADGQAIFNSQINKLLKADLI